MSFAHMIQVRRNIFLKGGLRAKRAQKFLRPRPHNAFLRLIFATLNCLINNWKTEYFANEPNLNSYTF